MIAGLPADQHAYGEAHGHSPLAANVVLIDFDSTLVPWGPLIAENRIVTPGSVAAVTKLREAGFRIVIFTSRMSRRWAVSVVGEGKADGFLENQREYVAMVLTDNGIQFDEITAEKIPAMAYIDDKAIRFEGDWKAVTRAIGL